MLTRSFYPGGRPHSLLGFGAMRLPVDEQGKICYQQAKEMVDRAIAGGINYFDTAYPYHQQTSEAFLGKALADHPRDSYLLADKLPVWLLEKAEDVPRLFHQQLERCQVEYFDCYLCHALDAERLEIIQKYQVLPQLEQLKKEGKIGLLGFSFHDKPEVLRQALELHHWDFCQLQLNYADWAVEDARQLYELTVEFGVPVIVMEPVRGGFLAQPPQQVADILRQGSDRSMASWALRFVASLPNVSLVLSGMTTMEQLEDNIATFSDPRLPLTEEEQKLVAQAGEALKGLRSIPCTGCRYCVPCPMGVDIPEIFHIYNSVKLFGKGLGGYKELLERKAGVDQCILCGSCARACPQGLTIPGLLEKVHLELKERLEQKK